VTDPRQSTKIMLPDFLRQLLPPKIRAFESLPFALRHDGKRRDLLSRTIGELRSKETTMPKSVRRLLNPSQCEILLSKLDEQCECEDVVVWTLASSLAFRSLRAAVLHQVCAAFEPYQDDELNTFTIIKERGDLSSKELFATDPKSLKADFVNDLNRSGVTKKEGPLIAFLHGEFDATSGKFVIHWHGITTIAKAKLLSKLKELHGYVRTKSGAAPIRRSAVRDRRRQFSYILKSYWPSRPMINGKRVRSTRRLPEPYHSLLLLWLDRQRLLDLTVMNGCWSKRAGGSESMRKLHLIISRWPRSLA